MVSRMRINESIWLPGMDGGVVVVGNDGPRIIIMIIYIFLEFILNLYYKICELHDACMLLTFEI